MSHRMKTRKRALLLGAIITAGCLALTACGDDGDDGSSGASGNDSGNQATGDPIKIAYGGSASGPQAVNGLGAQAVAHAWQEYTNATGGVDGHPVEIEFVDTKNTVPGATSVLQRFIGDDDVDAIFLTDLVAEGALGDLFKSATDEVAFISGGGSSDLVWTAIPGLFQPVSGSDYVQKAYADAAKTAGGTKYGWAACAEVAVCQEGGEKSVAYAGSDGGMEAIGVQLISASAANYTGECLAFIEDGTDAIALNLGYATGSRLAADCIQQGYEGIFSVMNSGFDQATFGEVSGFKSAGSTQGFPWWADEEPVQIYRDAMEEYSPDAVWQSGNTTSIWSGLELFKKAIENAQPEEITRATVLEAMYSIKDETLGGLLPEPVTFTEGEPSKKVECSWFFEFNAGDENPSLLPPPDGESGNGETGDLASFCSGYLEG